MSEIGSGSGSSYPGTLDANSSPEVNAPNPGKTKARKEVVEDLSACIIAIETTLGVNPQGSKSTVVARIDQEHNADGSHKDSYVITVSGSPQTVTGHKVFASGIDVGIWGIIGSDTNHRAGRTAVGASGAMWFMDDVRVSGSIHIARNPVADLEVAPKQYVDTSHIDYGTQTSETINATTDSSAAVAYTTNSDTKGIIIHVAGATNGNCSMIAVWRNSAGRDSYFTTGKGTLPTEPTPTAPNRIAIRFRNNHSSSQLVMATYTEVS